MNLTSKTPICFDCGKEGKPYKIFKVEEEQTITNSQGTFTIPKGSVYAKCKACFEKEPQIKYQECEIFSRSVGYYAPINRWNNGKREEYKSRKEFVIKDKT